MLHKLVIGALGAMAVMFSGTAFAQGTATEAKAARQGCGRRESR
jgi:hypothetical protein